MWLASTPHLKENQTKRLSILAAFAGTSGNIFSFENRNLLFSNVQEVVCYGVMWFITLDITLVDIQRYHNTRFHNIEQKRIYIRPTVVALAQLSFLFLL